MTKLINYMAAACVLFLCFNVAVADVYLHMGRGSNNRLDEANRDRNNDNRLFDSQNNNRGGYNVGSAFYYVGEQVRFEWTNQHGCNNEKMNCNIVLQYMCDDWLRDGTTTQTIPNTPEADGYPKYGRHESYEWYQKCSTRQRNKGLFTASQNLNGQTARFTRQNPNGQRNGFECPEERDYYPYWHPTPWRDIAVLTDNTTRCELYRNNSQNVRNYGGCFNHTVVDGVHRDVEVHEINNGPLCALKGFKWVDHGAWNIAPPECIEAPWTRVNHLGNTYGGETPHFLWTVPDHVHERCALRIRYNMSSLEYDGWQPEVINHKLNDRQGLKLGLTESYGARTPYAFQNNPDVDFGLGVEFELAINTAQIGRTFEDRTHRFAIRPRPSCVDSAHAIKALQVRGRRGNIVQTFPATEYDFTPNYLEIDTSDYVHIQWTGSNTNNANDDGQGRRQSDRKNIVQIEDMGRTYPQRLEHASMWNDTELCVEGGRRASGAFEITELFATSGADTGQFGGELSELDDCATYFNGQLVRFRKEGVFHAMCSRDNNFSNRQTKFTVAVDEGEDDDELSDGELAGVIIGSVLGFILLALAAVLFAMWYRKRQATFVAEGYTPVDTEQQGFSSMYVDNN
jgi:hypothetical protein